MNDNENKPVEPVEREAEAALPADQTEEMRQVDEQPAVAVVAEQQEPTRKSPVSWPWVGVALLAVAALLVVLVLNQQKTAMNEAVGRMDGATITKADLYDELIKQMGAEQAGAKLDSLMSLKLIELEAKKLNVVLSDSDIQTEIDNSKKGFPSDAQFEAALQQSSMTMESFKEQIQIQLKLRKIFEQQIKPSDDQLKKFYEDNKAGFRTPEKVRASHILLRTKAEADAVLAELKKGADFATLAKQKSTDPGSKDHGGDLNYFGRGVMNKEFETAAFNLKKGELSGVVQSPNGFHIIQLTDKKPAVAKYEDVKLQVKNSYVDQQMQSLIPEWLDKQKKAYNYKNLLAPSSPVTPAAPTATASGK